MKAIFIKIVRALAITLFLISIALSPILWPAVKIKWYELNPIDFDRDIWASTEISHASNAPYLRLQMASDLINNKKLIGKTENEIISMLGAPQENAPLRGVVYWLCPFSLDSMWLRITYKNGAVLNAKLVSD